MDRGEPAHVHVRRENRVAKFWLDPVVCERTGGFGRSEINKITRLVEEYREDLLEKWHEYFS